MVTDVATGANYDWEFAIRFVVTACLISFALERRLPSSEAGLKITALAIAALRAGSPSSCTPLYTAVVTRPILGARPFGASLRPFKIVPDDFVAPCARVSRRSRHSQNSFSNDGKFRVPLNSFYLSALECFHMLSDFAGILKAGNVK